MAFEDFNGFETPKNDDACDLAGIHLSGANARKSAVVLLKIDGPKVIFSSLYEKIGSSGTLFSDERILSILTSCANLQGATVDCPVSEPPCVACTLEVCPGVVRCEDVSVAMMMAVENRRERKGAHKLRPINPQNQRLWDVIFSRGGPWGNLEPSYSANLSPLVVRAKTLQRRLRSRFPDLNLRETIVPILIEQLQRSLAKTEWSKTYRSFETGGKVRRAVLTAISSPSSGEFFVNLTKNEIGEIAASVEGFHAFMAAAMAVWRHFGLAMDPANFFEASTGWVDLLNSDEGVLQMNTLGKNTGKSMRN